MSRRALAAFVAVPVVVALVGCLVAAAGNQRDLVLRGNGFAGEVVPVKTGSLACQAELEPAEAFDGVRFGVAGDRALAGPPVTVTVKRGTRTLARGDLAPGYLGQAKRLVELDRAVQPQDDLRVCFFNRGGRRLLLYGTPTAARGPDVTIDGKAKELGLQIDLTREPRSALSMLGTVADRASLQRPGPAGPWLVWLLAAVVLVAVPAVAVGAVRAATPPD
ncbi:MAG TPA: hypothetical protein VFY44_06515 [Thermoleophilaceae bacterium]|nr:hypothetical protein [Thermoleophilaceae bacterium]